jgi:DNA-binding response OmpR family regulator
MRVVVVEDSVEIARMVETILSLADITTSLVTSNFECLFAAETWQGVDAAVIDLMLPGVDGEDVVRYLAAEHPAVRRVVLSAVAHYRPGLDELATLLTKPVSPHTLLNALGVDRA